MDERVRALCIGRHPLLSDYLFCEYDRVAPLTPENWIRVALLSVAPVVVISMTRDPSEVRLVNLAGISGYVYLPAMTRERLLALLASIRRVAATDALLGGGGEYGRLPVQRSDFLNR